MAAPGTETTSDTQPNPRRFPWTRLLVAFAVCAVLWIVIVPNISNYGAEILIEGIVLWQGKPVDAGVHAYPVLRDGKFGEPTLVQHPSASSNAEFAIMSGRNWRRRYPAPNDVVVTVRVDPGHLVDCSPEDSERILSYADPATSPFRITVDGTRSEMLRIDLYRGNCERSAKSQL